ncbi:uncharacterized protein LOC127750649 [Frankliniella occidentalis]|uniref:Gustatory receptor n=1 Tax=Frankliniella occidentalis TaxID=133901 RepID=A0A9C6XRX4_FRAOC|nr:uncharacterized protein LOC127750649 [Frankliniella occidentalis]
MVHYSSALSLLARAVLLHVHSFRAPKRKQVARRAVLMCLGANLAFYAFHCIYHEDFYFRTWLGGAQFVTGLLPTLLISAIQDSFTCIVTASVDSLAGVADGVREFVNTLLHRRGPVTRPRELDELGGEQSDARAPARAGLRALRVRYQCVHDVVLATNWLYGWCNLVICSFSLLRGVTFLYCGVILTMARAAMLGDVGEDFDVAFDAADGVFFLFWGTVLIGKLLFICAIGEQMSSESSRISDALQAGITRCPDMDPSVKREIQWFICQTQRQKIRFGAFDLFYFDLRTMNRIIASGMTYIVVLVQFSAIAAHGRGQLKEQSNKTV